LALKELMAQKMSSLVENAEERRAKKVKKYTSRRLNEENRMTDPFFSLMKKKSKPILVDKSGKDLKRYEMGVEAMLGQVPLKDLK
jgi:adenylate kinase family enzyme